MIQRTRSHILEQESRFEFRKVLPATWVCRDKHDDYGIDCEVEIFTESGQATGLVFWVQLKATDSIDPSVTKKLYFERDKIGQFVSYDIPVVIVRYISDSKALYFRWAKGLAIPRTESKSIPVFFSDSCQWSDESPADISCYLQAQNWVKQGKVSLPIPTFIDRALDFEPMAIPYSNVNIVKTCLRNLGRHINIRREPREALLFIRISGNKIFMSLADIQCAEMKVTFDKVVGEHIPELKKHILVLFCSLMFDLGRKEIANDLIMKENLLSVVFKSKKYLISILPELLESQHFGEVLQSLEEYIRKDPGGSTDLQFALALLLTERRNEIGQDKIAAIGKFYENELTFHVGRGDNMAIALSHYNLAQHFKAQGETESAIIHYLKARKHGKFYNSAHYFFSDFAGLMFSIGKFRFAATFYSKAINLGSQDPVMVALHADALMYAGCYQEARDCFDKYLLANPDAVDNEEWQLKYTLLATHLEHGYPSVQSRKPAEAESIAGQGADDNALALDFLCRLAWYGRGIESSKAGNFEKAFAELVFAAVLYRDDPYVWAVSFVTGLDAKADNSILTFLIRVAYEYTEQDFILEVGKILEKVQPESIDAVLELIDLTIKDVKRKQIKVRVFSEDGAFEEIQF
ncbi:DUF4365 domain-containing protein [Dyadobacter fermentans]|uniref:DUF4365 domain-containing protein n=1 Tax=Dyadobacter fermentans (strain ATCC 700827 / DSM 18053 / CIP 107007 / KCTC 52180 / NS114) TaxID=471854 RepID=C6W398_DYAFD|nr:DUF4365 domain-containing protein [Dyadobacter fermentans]ACT92202.1 hypothetical protein Dfer_0950 [Dyadobacter fermentans DSM 18053]